MFITVCSSKKFRLTILFFILSGLDLINELENTVDEERKKQLIEDIYKMELTKGEPERLGFRGSLSASAPGTHLGQPCIFDSAHIAQTYSALCSLLILGDDLSRINKSKILEAVRRCQQSDGRLETLFRAFYQNGFFKFYGIWRFN